MTARSNLLVAPSRRRRDERRRRSWAGAGRGALALLTGAAAFIAASGALAGDAKAGRALAEEKCAVCHGLDGLSKIAEAPNLAGQNEAYLIAQLSAFKAGGRRNEMMSIVIQSLRDDDIANLAAYFSSIEIKVVKVPGE
jgi:cytochrome c553